MANIDLQDPHVSLVVKFTHEEWVEFFNAGTFVGQVPLAEDRSGREKVVLVTLTATDPIVGPR